MKVYTSGRTDAPAIMLLPGTCCHWEGNFGKVIPLLSREFHVLTVSYDGFDETEKTEFPSMLEETEKIEDFIQKQLGGRIRGVYGCSLGGSFVGLLAARGNIHMDYGILGSSDLDQSAPAAAKLMTGIMLPMVYPLIRDGKLSGKFFESQMEKMRRNMPEYVDAFLDMFGGARPYVTKKSVKNQFYSDLITPLPEQIDPPDTQIHIFYAMKMGEKYRKRYLAHFAHPVLHEMDLQHEELLACYPEQWAELVTRILHGEANG